MGRPPKNLRDRVLAGTFRADRYAALLGGELLPKTAPFSDRRRRALWQLLRQEQLNYQQAQDDTVFSAEKHRALAAEAFTRLVRTLHGAKLPWWLEEEWERARRRAH
jgi:hypothetical protein